ncbi:DUF4124 domain-containing protein [Chitinibacter tainanensis]|uniref:DUF4124 domain-containing protein n=1 Tax=Chitinibacter tainanensis TaxID=230667 RepID=UPI00235657E3|nr:DUF4124 domain-containing protein [Chitinibacter tainanensis]
MRAVIGLAIVAAGLALSAQAQVYKWVDSTGRTVYSDQPPPKEAGKAKPINIKESAVTTVSAPKADAAASSVAKPGAAAASPASPTTKPARDEAACKAAQERLNFLQQSKLFKAYRPDGSIEYLPAEKKTAEIAEKQAYLEKNCK